MPFASGDAFHQGASNSTRHLHIVLFAAIPPHEPAIVVSVNTVKSWTDQTLVLEIGDHPYISRSSAVSFNRAAFRTQSELLSYEVISLQYAPGFRCFDWDVPVDPVLLERLIQGALDSLLTPKGIKRAIRKRLGLPPS